MVQQEIHLTPLSSYGIKHAPAGVNSLETVSRGTSHFVDVAEAERPAADDPGLHTEASGR